jgi:hypothetical protein
VRYGVSRVRQRVLESPQVAGPFSAWATRWTIDHRWVTSDIGHECLRITRHHDAQAGHCFIRRIESARHEMVKEWEVALDRVSLGQSPRCQTAINQYRLAARREVRIQGAYLRKHQHDGLLAIVTGLTGELFIELERAAQSRTSMQRESATRLNKVRNREQNP